MAPNHAPQADCFCVLTSCELYSGLGLATCSLHCIGLSDIVCDFVITLACVSGDTAHSVGSSALCAPSLMTLCAERQKIICGTHAIHAVSHFCKNDYRILCIKCDLHKVEN